MVCRDTTRGEEARTEIENQTGNKVRFILNTLLVIQITVRDVASACQPICRLFLLAMDV